MANSEGWIQQQINVSATYIEQACKYGEYD